MLDTPGGKEYLRFFFLVPSLEVPETEEKMRPGKECLERKLCVLSDNTTQQIKACIMHEACLLAW
jgi:hypothetical protein